MRARSTRLARLVEIVGEGNVSTAGADLESYGLDRTRSHEPNPLAVVFVETVDQVIALVRLALAEGLGLVPSGGRTGLVGGACATAGELVVSFERMNAILDFNTADRAVTVQPGVITAVLQTYAQERGLYYPVDFASSGSSQIGGNIATNAGGIRVLRYGLTRDRISGLKVVTGAGELLDLNRGLTKNATGYDLRHLFIGSEGTLGFIVEATIELTRQPPARKVLLLAVPKMADCLAVLDAFRERVVLSAFEFFSETALARVLAGSHLSRPFADVSEYYVLAELECAAEADLDAALAAFAECTEKGWVSNGIVAASERQNRELWQLRENISEAIAPATPCKLDLSVRVSHVPDFLRQAEAEVTRSFPASEVVWFGHIGDGNLHLNVLKPAGEPADKFRADCERLGARVLALVAGFGGSVSAEHGVGLLKKDQLGFSRSPEEIRAMRAIKAVFDPAGIMNPGKML